MKKVFEILENGNNNNSGNNKHNNHNNHTNHNNNGNNYNIHEEDDDNNYNDNNNENHNNHDTNDENKGYPFSRTYTFFISNIKYWSRTDSAMRSLLRISWTGCDQLSLKLSHNLLKIKLKLPFKRHVGFRVNNWPKFLSYHQSVPRA